MSNIKIINATAEDFDIETFSSEPSDADATGDHQDGRIVKYLKNVYVWHDNTGDWIKFPNIVDYEAFETDLATQESDRATAVSSLVTIDGSLETRLAAQETARGDALDSIELVRSQAIDSLEDARSTEHANLSSELSSQISARTSAVDSEEVRAESVEAVLSGALATAISDREDDVSAEKSRAEAAEAVISGNLVNAISDREDDVSAEKSRAEAAQAVISGNISSEASVRLDKDGSLETRLAAQETARTSEYSALNSTLVVDTALRSTAHSAVQSSIDIVDGDLDAILLASDADKDQFTEIVSFINSVDAVNDGELSTEFSELAAGVVSAAADRSSGDSTVQSSVDSAALARSQEDSTLQSSIGSAELARSQEDSVLQSAIDVEASVRLEKDDSLATRLAAQETARANEFSAVGSNISVEALARASQDVVLSQAISSEASTELVKEGSLEDVLDSTESALQSTDVVLSEELSTQIANQGSSNLSLGDNFSDELDSMVLARSQEDSTLQSSIGSAELARSQEDSVLQSALDVEESVQASQDASLEVRIAAQEDDRVDDYSVMNSSLDSAEVARSQEDSALTSSLAIENARIDAVLANASIHDGETLDTFVELVSFLTEVDTESDDALDSYVSSIDSSIAAENSELLAMRDAQSTELSTQISARGSALDSLESRSESAEASIESNISALESVENGRHLTVNFSNATSLTVEESDLSGIGFTAGNGMIQVFQEVSSGTFRHLVAPSTFNPSTGAMTFDLGSTAKDGFAVFYSFASDDQASGGFELPGSSSSSSSSYAQFMITDATLNFVGSGSGDASRMTFDVSGMTATNYQDYMNLSGDAAYLRFGNGDYKTSSGNLTFTWASDYSTLTLDWTNSNTPGTTSGNYLAYFFWGSTFSGTQNYVYTQTYFDATTLALKDDMNSLGEYLANDATGDGGFLISPPYIPGSGTCTDYKSNFTWDTWTYRSRTKSASGPMFEILLDDVVFDSAATTAGRNYKQADIDGSSYLTRSLFGQNGAVRFENSSGTKYFAAKNMATTNHLYSELSADSATNYTNSAQTVSAYIDNYGTNGPSLKFGYFQLSGGNSTSVQAPGANTTIDFYFYNDGGTDPRKIIGDAPYATTQNLLTNNWRGDSDNATDLKISIDMTDDSYEVYRNSNVAGSPTWVSVTRGYLSNQSVS